MQTPDVSFTSEAPSDTAGRETLAITVKRDKAGSTGFSVAGGVGGGRDGLYISNITPGGAADLEGKLQIGDRLLSIDGTKMKDTRHDQAVALLTGLPEKEVCLTCTNLVTTSIDHIGPKQIK